MYKNLGYTIKSIARIGFWVALAVAEIAGIIMIVQYFGMGSYSSYYRGYGSLLGGSLLLTALVTMAVAPGVCWLMSLALYTVGQMVENSDIRTDLAVKQAKAMSAVAAMTPPSPQPAYQQNPYPPEYTEPPVAEEPVPERTVYYPEDYRW